MLPRRLFHILRRPASTGAQQPPWSAWSTAKTFFNRHPFVANCLVYGGMYAGAEVSQQTINHVFTNARASSTTAAAAAAPPGSGIVAKLKYDLESVKRYVFLGTCVYPPVFYVWYKWLDARFKGSAARIVCTKIFLDQFVLGPPSLCCFFLLMSWLEGKADVAAECREKFAATFALDCLFWIPVQAVNFGMVSPKYRVPFIGAMAFVWLNILCIVKNFESYVQVEGEHVDSP